MFALLTVLMTWMPWGLDGSPVAAEPPHPLPPSVVVLGDLEDLYLPVTFDHLGHAGMAEMGDGCVVCHHYSPVDAPHPACRTCHLAREGRSLGMPGLKGAYHRQCLSCHVEWSHRNACNECHEPRAGLGREGGPFHDFATAHPPTEAQEAIVFRTEQEAPVITFHHLDHTRVFGLRCADCHQGESCGRCHDRGEHAAPLEHRDLRARCFSCHQVQGRQDCRFCHDAVARPETFDHEAVVGWSLDPYHCDLSCATCHGAADVFATPSPNCYSCHTDMGIRGFEHAALEPDRDCGECHGEVIGAAAGAAHPHPALDEGCEACHDPRGSAEPFFLVDAEPAVCFSCHETVEDGYRGAVVVHGTSDDGHRCSACHKPHGSAQARLLRRPIEALCLSCHDRSVEASDGARLANVADRLAACIVRHGPTGESDCTACHQPHASANGRLLRAAYPGRFYASYADGAYDLCFTCHPERQTLLEPSGSDTGFRSGDTNLHWVHVQGPKGRTCQVCHDPHASDLPHFLRESVPFDKGLWAFALGYEQTEGGGHCAGLS